MTDWVKNIIIFNLLISLNQWLYRIKIVFHPTKQWQDIACTEHHPIIIITALTQFKKTSVIMPYLLWK